MHPTWSPHNQSVPELTCEQLVYNAVGAGGDRGRNEA